MGAQDLPILGFIHIATHGPWREVLSRQEELLRSTGLLARAERVYVGIVGPECDAYSPADPKIEVVCRSPRLEEYEFPTLAALQQACRSHKCLVFYIHSKGVFQATVETADWRDMMTYFVIERYADCIFALNDHDVCGVNWQNVPWPHFSGNFWWAHSQYVASLPSIAELRQPTGTWNHSERHQCERWIGSGPMVRLATLHQSHVDHYRGRYPREFFAGPQPTYDSHGDGHLRVAVVFDNLVRRDTTGIYCLRALRRLTAVSHFLPEELTYVARNAFDLFLFIDDGLEYELPDLHPSAFWAIDTHINPERLLRRTRAVDFVFAAQCNGVELLRKHGINCLGWLPLACDPDIHRRHSMPLEFDTCLVATLGTPGRRELAEFVQHTFPRSFVGQRFFDEMARTYSASRIVLNQSIAGDINMRVFEALACGALLVTDDVYNNGLAKLFQERKHLVTYRSLSELATIVEHYLTHKDEADRIAAAGRAEAIARHSYVHRMQTLLQMIHPPLKVQRSPHGASTPLARTEDHIRPEVSIIIPVFNGVAYTRQCLESIRCSTSPPYELIVVDNGSTDGTEQYLASCDDVRVIANPSNRGFSAAVNQGMRAASGRHYLLLNNDTIVSQGWLDRLLLVLRSDERVGLVGPCSNGVPGPQRISPGCRDLDSIDQFSSEFCTQHRGQTQEVTVLVGFCVLIRREVVDSVGLLDESFGVGTYEDYEYCRRAAAVGFRLLICRDVYVHHFSSVTLHATGIDVPKLLEHNRKLFDSKCSVNAGQRSSSVDTSSQTGISIVIVVHNGFDFTRQCIESVEQRTPEPHEIVVVDNGSSDDTRDLCAHFPRVRILRNEENLGFPSAANRGISASAGADVVLLNNDVIVTQGWLGRMKHALYSAAEIGLVGPCSNCVSGPQQVPSDYSDIGSGLNAFAERWGAEHNKQIEVVERLVGFCLMIRRDALDRIGLLDERFGVGNFEDDDYCRRASLAGFRAVVARDCFVHHFGSATFRATGIDYPALLERNRRLFEAKWKPLCQPPESEKGSEVNVGVPTAPDGAPRISLCMIVRDSSRTLTACLESARAFVDEIIVVDTGSQDNTIAIAREFGARISEFPWCDDFSAARNESLRDATGDWIFWMDADDTIDEASGRGLREILRKPYPNSTMGFVMQVHCPSSSAPSPYATPTAVDHVKLFRNDPRIRFSGRIHEQLLPSIRRLGGDVEWTELFVRHSGSDTSAAGRARKQERDLRILRLELEDDPDSTFTLFNIGMTLLDMGRPAEALDPLARSLQLAEVGDSHLRKIYALLCQAYWECGRQRTALRTALQGLQVCPGDGELLFRCGALHQAMGSWAEAEQCFLSVIAANTERHFSSVDRGIFGIKAWHNLAIVYGQQGRAALQADAWRKVINYDPNNWAAWRELLFTLASAKDITSIEQLAGVDTALPLAAHIVPLARALAHVVRDNAPAAIAELEVAWTDTDSIHLLTELCELAAQHQLNDAAKRALCVLTARCPDDPSAHYNLAMICARLGHHREALRAASKSLELRPEFLPAQSILAVAKAAALAVADG